MKAEADTNSQSKLSMQPGFTEVWLYSIFCYLIHICHARQLVWHDVDCHMLTIVSLTTEPLSNLASLKNNLQYQCKFKNKKFWLQLRMLTSIP